MDLTQAEAVIDLIDAETADAAANAAGQLAGAILRKIDPIYDNLVDILAHFHAVLDYPDEDIDPFELAQFAGQLDEDAKALNRLLATCHRGRIVKDGPTAVILGSPNAGKSSLLNCLAGFDRVIVTDIPGTTRDAVERTVRLGRHLLRLLDTAGIRETDDQIERMGVERSLAAAQEADLALFVVDREQAVLRRGSGGDGRGARRAGVHRADEQDRPWSGHRGVRSAVRLRRSHFGEDWAGWSCSNRRWTCCSRTMRRATARC